MQQDKKIKKLQEKHEAETKVITSEIAALNSQIDDLDYKRRKANVEYLFALISLYGLKIGDKVRQKHHEEIGEIVDVTSNRYGSCTLDIRKVKKDGTASKISTGWYISDSYVETLIKVEDTNE